MPVLSRHRCNRPSRSLRICLVAGYPELWMYTLPAAVFHFFFRINQQGASSLSPQTSAGIFSGAHLRKRSTVCPYQKYQRRWYFLWPALQCPSPRIEWINCRSLQLQWRVLIGTAAHWNTGDNRVSSWHKRHQNHGSELQLPVYQPDAGAEKGSPFLPQSIRHMKKISM